MMKGTMMSEFSAETIARLEAALTERMARFDLDDLACYGESWLAEQGPELCELEGPLPEHGMLSPDCAWNRIASIGEALHDVNLLDARYSLESPHSIEIPFCGDGRGDGRGDTFESFIEGLRESECAPLEEALRSQVPRSLAAWQAERDGCLVWRLMREAEFYYVLASWGYARNQLQRLGF